MDRRRASVGETNTQSQFSSQGLIFVIDSQDKDRIDEARQELERILADREMRDVLLMVFANKQDLPGGEILQNCRSPVKDVTGERQNADLFMPRTAMTPAQVTERLGLHKMKDRSWYVHPR